MAKPIFLVGFTHEANPEAIYRAGLDLEKKIGDDYHVITYRTSKIADIQFEVLNAVNASDIEIEEIIKIARAEITQVMAEPEEQTNEKNKENNE
jgi:hypothetical protein